MYIPREMQNNISLSAVNFFRGFSADFIYYNDDIARLDRFLKIRRKYTFRVPFDFRIHNIDNRTTASQWIERFKKLDLWESSDYQVANFYRNVFLNQMERIERKKERKLKGRLKAEHRQYLSSHDRCYT